MNAELREATEALRSAGVESARADARVLWRHASKHDLPLGPLIARRIAQEPISYITGHKEFWSLDFEVGPGVLIPRPETETLVEQALRDLPDREASIRILDVGTGSGCLLIALLKELPKAIGVGIDSSAEALAWARRNVGQYDLGSRCELVNGGWSGAAGTFDIIVSNPPYVRSADLRTLQPDIRCYEPRFALDGGQDGFDAYRQIIPLILNYLNQSGMAFLEIGAGQQRKLEGFVRDQGLQIGRIVPDLAGIPRCIVIRSPGIDR